MNTKYSFIVSILAAAIILFPHNTFPQTAAKPFFSVEGEVLKPLKITLEDLLKFNQTEVTAKDTKEKNISSKAFASLTFWILPALH